ncbi:hypothetical protein TREMEDRAFT_64507 [Tremella mesenterica DSM 1558]|uniref:uncharacterized protein n=1 Tax=Tremella mesenterica (strain ATCC 24925 / CBS 8224 / DSM 1558 / NBRC 9311 / NRRL Y-6157 / RJB 2259-6 / UBC 559-6) TaxID=578456 RepID=UPI0003F49207|nr:uncharacterized protein TREMEDRAFT_64507 [Tremella mesenterica DSM 1558]EIW67257.1 hypothetical protein TREMEDRAFT_64507 [Tremella mesenterica DSM 1558]
MATSYLAPHRPVSLRSLFDVSASKGGTPTIDLEWGPFHAHVEAFLNAIDAYTIRAKTEIANRASDHATSVRDLHAEKDECERRITLEREREVEMLAAIENERLTLADLTSSLSHIQKTLAKVKEQSASLETELTSLTREVNITKAEKERQAKVLDEMRGRDGDELRALEEALGWKVEGVKQDLLLMKFTLLDPSDPDREFSLVVDVSKPEYSVPNCSPPLPNLPELVKQLNTDREFFAFIKRVRKAFRALIPPQDPRAMFEDLSGPGQRPTQLFATGDD